VPTPTHIVPAIGINAFRRTAVTPVRRVRVLTQTLGVPDLDEGSGVISGNITVGGVAAVGATLSLIPDSIGLIVKQTVTGVGGAYSFSALPAGTYQILVDDPANMMRSKVIHVEVPVIPPVAWNSEDAGSDLVLSELDRLATLGTLTTLSTARSDRSQSAGKFYQEFTVAAYAGGVGTFGVGVAGAAMLLTQYVGETADSWGLWGNFSTGTRVRVYHNNAHGGNLVAAIAQGLRIGMAVDLDAGKLWFAINGTWIGGGNPTAGTGAQATGVAGTLFLAMTLYDDGEAVRLVQPDDHQFAAPSGFTNGW
jgi:hypothetical protein